MNLRPINVLRNTLAAGAVVVLPFLGCAAFAQEAATSAPGSSAETPTVSAAPTNALLESGFHHLYELNFKSARAEFVSYQQLVPDDPMGKGAEAASYLFDEFNEKGVFTSEFFLNDSKFLKGVAGSPEENRNPDFERVNAAAREQAKTRLKSNPKDARALLVLTMTDGMESDYDALIVKKQLAAVSLTKQAEAEASALLQIDPNADDAYVALGAGHYIIGCLPGFKRAFLWFGGVHGDKELGMQQEEIAAYHAHYFQPFAKILLALAYEREHEPEKARVLLGELSQEFPDNPLYLKELALVRPGPPKP
ncbi:MAG TPA: hypothetical protein VMU43_07795 [Candidatus Acidoferrum sp.]|nr:hypothetical protein [Candidatus Acidoferrum sp.]